MDNYVTNLQKVIELVMLAFGNAVRTGPVAVPAYTHSLSVGLSLIKYEYSLRTVLAGFLHDTLEDTSLTSVIICRLFDNTVSNIVEACTLDPKLGDTPEGEEELFNRVVKLAENGDVEPLVVKIADSLDNLKTNAHLNKAYQMGAYERGEKWYEAGCMYIPNHLILDDLGITLEREVKRLGL